MKDKEGVFYAGFSFLFLSFYFLEGTIKILGFAVGRFVKLCLSVFGGNIYYPSWILAGFVLCFFVLGLVLTLGQIWRLKVLRRRLLAKRIEAGSDFLELVKRLGLEGKVILIEDNQPFAKVLGFLNGKIFVSSVLVRGFGREELEAVLLHEKKHLEGKDNLWRLLFYFLVYSTPFYLLLKPLYEKFQIYQETRADEFAIKVLGGKKAVLLALRKTMLLDSSFFSSYSGAWRERIEFLQGKSVNFWRSAVIVIFLILSLSLFSFKVQGELKEEDCIKGTSCYAKCSHIF